MTYPHSPGFAAGSETSQEAAERLTSKDELCGLIKRHLLEQVYNGSTVDEAKVYCEAQAGRDFDRSTVAARFTELTEAGEIALSTEKRLTPKRRNAGVYLHKDFAPVGSLLKAQRQSAQKLQAELTTLRLKLGNLKAMVAKQAEDDGLWFYHQTAPEAYLQQELRRLHAAIEGL